MYHAGVSATTGPTPSCVMLRSLGIPDFRRSDGERSLGGLQRAIAAGESGERYLRLQHVQQFVGDEQPPRSRFLLEDPGPD